MYLFEGSGSSENVFAKFALRGEFAIGEQR